MKNIIYLILIFLFPCNSFSQTKAEQYLKSGNAKFELSDYKGAIRDFSNAIKSKPNLFDAYHYRAQAKGRLKDFRGAIQDYNQAIKIKPDFAEAYCFRGLNKLIVGDKDGGCLDLSKSAELGYSSAIDFSKEYCESGDHIKKEGMCVKVASFSGTVQQNTDDFTVKSKKWKVVWSIKKQDPEGGVHASVFLCENGEAIEGIFNTFSEETGESIFRKQGTFDLKIICASAIWDIEIFEFVES